MLQKELFKKGKEAYKMFNFMNDDKNLVIMAVTVLGFTLLLHTGDLSAEKANILNSLFSGLFGIAVGRATKD